MLSTGVLRALSLAQCRLTKETGYEWLKLRAASGFACPREPILLAGLADIRYCKITFRCPLDCTQHLPTPLIRQSDKALVSCAGRPRPAANVMHPGERQDLNLLVIAAEFE